MRWSLSYTQIYSLSSKSLHVYKCRCHVEIHSYKWVSHIKREVPPFYRVFKFDSFKFEFHSQFLNSPGYSALSMPAPSYPVSLLIFYALCWGGFITWLSRRIVCKVNQQKWAQRRKRKGQMECVAKARREELEMCCNCKYCEERNRQRTELGIHYTAHASECIKRVARLIAALN